MVKTEDIKEAGTNGSHRPSFNKNRPQADLQEVEPLEESDNESSDDEIQATPQVKEKQKAKAERKKAEYVLTDARKQQFEKARLVRAENIANKKKIKDEENAKIKLEMEKKILKKAEKLNKKIDKKKQILDEIVSSDSEEDSEVIVKRIKKATTKTDRKRICKKSSL